jgi:hypothetical protein
MEPGQLPPNGTPGAHEHSSEEWAQLLARTVAHLAAQLTMTQIRLRALATELDAAGVLDAGRVAATVAQLARAETGAYLRENLGDALAEVIDLDALETDLIGYLQP